MKRIIFILAFAALPLLSQAQTLTNIDVRVTTTVIVTGVSTNSSNATLSLSATGNKKDVNRINGWVFAYNTYRASGGVLSFDNWLKQDAADRADSYSTAKQQADNAAILAKLTALLTANTDLLSNADLSNLATIAAKAP